MDLMKPPADAPPWLGVFTAEERPDLWERAQGAVFNELWPEYNHHGRNASQYFGDLVPRFARFQSLFVDLRSDQLVARARTIPFCWDGTLEDLPPGIDAVGLRAVDDLRGPNTLSALSAEVVSERQRSGLSAWVLVTMATIARTAGLAPLVAPVRPSWKDRFPLTRIEDYASWRRGDGRPYDPWLRLHLRLGARILRHEPESMEFAAPVSDWESWTRMHFHRDAKYVFPGGLAPLTVAEEIGYYWEPNVWMMHEVTPGTDA
jgi:hypothetical protein